MSEHLSRGKYNIWQVRKHLLEYIVVNKLNINVIASIKYRFLIVLLIQWTKMNFWVLYLYEWVIVFIESR